MNLFIYLVGTSLLYLGLNSCGFFQASRWRNSCGCICCSFNTSWRAINIWLQVNLILPFTLRLRELTIL